jgi:hypothetical protein
MVPGLFHIIQNGLILFKMVQCGSKWFNGGSEVVVICKTGKDSIFLHSLTDTEL